MESLTRGDFMICTGMFGSGARTGLAPTTRRCSSTRRDLSTVKRESAEGEGLFIMRADAARLFAGGTNLLIFSRILACAWHTRSPMTRIVYPTGDASEAALRVGASISVFDHCNRMLLMLRADTQTWGLPGGGMNVGESIEECALRECFEETGIQASITRLVGLYSNKNMLIDYGD